MYGMIPSANMPMRLSAPPVNMPSTPAIPPAACSMNSRKATPSIPGTGMYVPMR